MATRDDNQLGTILLFVIAGFVFVLAVKLFGLIFAGTESLIIESTAAFAGAFFAFLFLRLADFFKWLFNRAVKHYDSLVSLEIELNKTGGIIHDNIFNIDNIVKVLSSGNMSFNVINPIPLNETHLLKLLNIDIMNKLYEVHYDIRRMNDDAETFKRGYTILLNALIQKHITHEDYMVSVQKILQQLIFTQTFQKLTQKKVLRLLAEISVLIRTDKPIASHLVHWMIMRGLHKASEDEINAEYSKLRHELEETAKQSRKDIETIKHQVARSTGLDL